MDAPEQPYHPYQPPRAPVSTDLHTQSMYTAGQVAAGALLGSPMAGAWLLASNCKVLGDEAARRRALGWGAASTLALFGLAFLLPKGFPSSALPAAYTVTLYSIAKSRQGSAIAGHLEAGGRRYSSWRVVGIGLGFIVLIFATVIGIVLLLPEGALPE